MTLGEIINKRRNELNLNQEQIALALGLKNRSSISKVEKNKVDLTYEQLKKLMVILKLTPNQLFEKEKIKETRGNIKTKYGEIKVIENEDNSITVTYNTEKNVLTQMCSSNQIKFITIEPYTNKILNK